MPPLSAFIAELRRRRVFRVAAFYGGIAFVIVQIIDGTFEVMGIPAWVSRLLIILLGVGFPVALGLAWVFDITPEGIVRTEGRSTGKPGTSNRTLIVVTILAIAFGIWGRWGGAGSRTSGDASYNIAVMYFENLTGDSEMEWIESGMVEMLTARLGQVPGVRVVSSQRVFDILKNLAGDQRTVQPAMATQIAREAGAATMLLGSVMGSGNRLRLSTQLVEVATGELVSSNILDSGPGRSLFDLADSLTMQLVAKLGISPEVADASLGTTYTLTSSLTALKHYVAGMENINRAQYDNAIENLTAATMVDSTFALAWYNLGLAHGWSGTGLAGQAYAAAHRHKQYLSPRERRLVEAAVITSLAERKAAYELFIGDYPDEKYAWYQYGELLFHNYWRPSAYRVFKRTVELDKHFLLAYDHLGSLYLINGEFEEAEALIERGLELDSTNLALHFQKVILLAAMDNPAGAKRQIEVLKGLAGDPQVNLYANWAVVLEFMLDSEVVKADTQIESFFDRHPGYAFLELPMHTGYQSRMGRFRESNEQLQAALTDSSRSRDLFWGGLMAELMGEGELTRLRGQQILARFDSGLEPFVEVATMGHYLLFLEAMAQGSDTRARLEIGALAQLAEGVSNDMDLLYYRAQGAFALEGGDLNRAIRLFENVVTSPSQGLDVDDFRRPGMARLAEALYRSGRFEEASGLELEFPYQILLSTPDQAVAQVEFLLYKAASYTELGQVEQARNIYESILLEWDNPDQDHPLVREVYRRHAALQEASS